MGDIQKKISAPDFNPEKYVKEISQVCIGGLELQKHKNLILTLSDETNQALKKNVYKNYMQFIETAREISHLEGEMYQLSHLLSEQRALLATMGSSSMVHKVEEEHVKFEARQKEVKEEKRINELNQIYEKVEDCIVLTDVPGRELIHEGDLVELHLVESTAIHRCHAFLLSDILLITTWISNRRGMAKYKYEAAYELQSLAVVNVRRDLGNVKHAFQLLLFPDTRLFQCANQQAKDVWLKKLDEAKKAGRGKDNKSTDGPPASSERQSPQRMESADFYSASFGLDESDDCGPPPEWLCDSPEDLDVLIAQRHFEDAFALFQKTNSFLEKAPHTSSYLDIKTKVEMRVKQLTQVLLNELSVSTERSMHGGLRSSRRAVKLLNKLGKSNQACELYLRLCTSVIKSQTKRVKREFATTAYVKQLSTVFFSNLCVITIEFQFRAFPNYPSCYSAFVVWANSEVSHFTSGIIKQIFMPQTPLETLSECVDIVRKQCAQVCEVGLDLVYQVDGQLNGPISRALSETGDKLMEAVKLRASEDTWKRSHHPKPAIHKLMQEFSAFNLPPLKNYLTGDGWLELTTNTLQFCRLFKSLLEDGLRLANRDLEHALTNVLYQVFQAQLRHVSDSFKVDRFKPEQNLIHTNAVFLIDHFLKICLEKYSNKTGHTCNQLEKLKKEYLPLIKEKTIVSNVTGYI